VSSRQRRSARLLTAGLAFVLVATGTGPGLAQEPDPTGPDPGAPPTVPEPTVPEPTVPPTFPPSPVPPTLPPDLSRPVDPAVPADPGPLGPSTGDELPPAPTIDPSPAVRVLLAELANLTGEDRLAAERSRLDAARWAKGEADRELERAQQAVIDAEEALAEAESLLAQFAVTSFMYASGGVDVATAKLSMYSQKKERQLTTAVLDHRLTVVDDTRRALTDAYRDRDDRERAVAEAARQVADVEGMVWLSEQALLAADREHRTARAQNALVFYDPADEDRWQLEIVGESVLTADEITAWFDYVGVTSRAAAPVADLARWYIEEGTIEGLRGDVAFAQAVLETGSFTNRDTILYNNYAGIGHCDSCPSGFPFETPQEGVRAQIQLLKSYVFEEPEYAHPLVDRRLRGPAGCCQTWNELGGVWASVPHYGPIVLTVYRSMLEYALARRVAYPMLRPPV
jgi:hypothetical protein